MLEIIGIIVAILAIIVIALLGYAATKPKTVSYTRSTRINAPPERIATLISDFKSGSSGRHGKRRTPR